jgi:hypothetical protein
MAEKANTFLLLAFYRRPKLFRMVQPTTQLSNEKEVHCCSHTLLSRKQAQGANWP